MIVAGIYLLGVVLFVVVFMLTGMPRSFGDVTRQAREATATLTNPDLDDLAKEKAAQAASLAMLKIAVAITLKGGITIAATLLPFWAADILNIRPWQETTAFALRWDVLLGTTVAAMGIWYGWRRLAGQGD